MAVNLRLIALDLLALFLCPCASPQCLPPAVRLLLFLLLPYENTPNRPSYVDPLQPHRLCCMYNTDDCGTIRFYGASPHATARPRDNDVFTGTPLPSTLSLSHAPMNFVDVIFCPATCTSTSSPVTAPPLCTDFIAFCTTPVCGTTQHRPVFLYQTNRIACLLQLVTSQLVPLELAPP